MSRRGIAGARGVIALLAALVALAALLAAPAARGASIESRTVVSRGKKRTYALYVPAGVVKDRIAPLLVSLHGSTSNGKTAVDRWTSIADAHGMIVVGPDATDNKMWVSPQDGPLFLKDVVDDVAKSYALDGRRLYIFGHSAGANFALQMAVLESEYFAAGAIHAGAISSDYYSIFDAATRKIPLAIYIGDRDQFYPIDVVRGVKDALLKRGFDLLYKEMPGHDHNYGAVAPDINKEIWDFFAGHPLPADPKYTNYQDPK
ncbi:MAG TPA: PHB depolymerase family esterase [Thermoanaerobaculia bacterium]|nr:PHB depolymerase family esterase [Thermoanaerobaculia bacterium]